MTSFKSMLAWLRRHQISSALVAALLAGSICTVIYPETMTASREAVSIALDQLNDFSHALGQSAWKIVAWIGPRMTHVAALLIAAAALLHAFSVVAHLRQHDEDAKSCWRRPHRHELVLIALYLTLAATELTDFAADPADVADRSNTTVFSTT